METIAVYWEPVISTYGIAERTGLSMITYPLRRDPCDDSVCSVFQQVAPGGDMVLAFMHPAIDGELRLHLVLAGVPAHFSLEGSAASNGSRLLSGPRMYSPVEVIYFQGPHFGDRYGIADAAFSALNHHGVPLLAAACSGASVYMVLPGGTARAARQALSAAFAVPDRNGGV